MSLATLERAIVAGARVVLKNPKLKANDLREWSTDEKAVAVNLRVDEVAVYVPDPGVWIAVFKTMDRRAG